MAIILDGKKLSEEIASILKEKIALMKRKPTLAIVQIGNLYSSNVYIKHKKAFADKIGALVEHIVLKEDVSLKEVLKLIKKLNKNKKVQGILVQMPIPEHLDKRTIIDAIDPRKDVDGLHSTNAGKLFIGDMDGVKPATPKGIISLLNHYDINLDAKKVLVIGRSLLVGKPLAMLLLNENATVTIAHSHTKDLAELSKEHDVVIVAVGKPFLITKDHVKQGQVIIDVGTNAMDGTKTLEEIGKKRLVGDVIYDEVSNIVEAISPVPGGVGPMTVASLFENLVEVSCK